MEKIDCLSNKSWMYKPKGKADRINDEHYQEGVKAFLNFAVNNSQGKNNGQLSCPCYDCENRQYYNVSDVNMHLILHGFTPEYTIWKFHGECCETMRSSEDKIPPVESKKFSEPIGIDANELQESHARPTSMESQISPATSIGTCNATTGLVNNDVSPTTLLRTEDYSSSVDLQRDKEGPTKKLKRKRAHLEEVEREKTDTHDKVRRGRGVARLESCLPPEGETWSVKFYHGQPVCDKGDKLKHALGCYARMEHLFPVAKMWKDNGAADESFDIIFDELKRRFVFEDSESGVAIPLNTVRYFCKVSLQKKITAHRSLLKKRYWDQYINKQLPLPIKSPIKRLPDDAWEMLKAMWSSEQKQDEVAKNKNNRAHVKLMHRRGSVSIAKHRYQLKQCVEGKDINEVDQYCSYYKDPQKGDYGDPQTRKRCEEVQKWYNEIRRKESARDGSSSASMCLKQAIARVYGPHHGGYERGFGCGAPPRYKRNVAVDYSSNHSNPSTPPNAVNLSCDPSSNPCLTTPPFKAANVSADTNPCPTATPIEDRLSQLEDQIGQFNEILRQQSQMLSMIMTHYEDLVIQMGQQQRQQQNIQLEQFSRMEDLIKKMSQPSQLTREKCGAGGSPQDSKDSQSQEQSA